MSNDTEFDVSAWIGRHQAFAAIARKCTFAQAVALKILKEALAFEPLGLNWADFCKTRLGVSRSRAEELINTWRPSARPISASPKSLASRRKLTAGFRPN